MKNKIFYISSTVLLVIITSSLSASYSYKYAKNEAMFEKEAAVKGVEFDMREQLSEEALEQAEDLIEEEISTTQSPAQTQALTFLKYLKDENYEDAWVMLSENAQKSYRRASGLKNVVKNAKSFEVVGAEFRTSSALSELTAVVLDITYKYENSTYQNGEVTCYVRSINESTGWIIDDVSVEE